jgi:hypothetical protein
MKRIGEFELIDHGVDHSQYFQGCGVAFTRWQHVVTGIGHNPAEAIDDCLELLAQSGWETRDMEYRILDDLDLHTLPTEPDPCTTCDKVNEDDTTECEWCELSYFVSIRFNPQEA